jgi:hypothetical protein
MHLQIRINLDTNKRPEFQDCFKSPWSEQRRRHEGYKIVQWRTVSAG